MDARTRTIIEMGRRSLAFFVDHKDQVPATLPALIRLRELLARADQLIIQQKSGLGEVRAATVDKRDMRKKLRRTYLPIFTRDGEAAAVERPELARKFELPREALPYLAFRSAVQAILTEAQNQQELLLRHGLVEPAAEVLAKGLADFDRAVERSEAGRRAHVGARAELTAISDELLLKVRQLDGLVRFVFANNAEGLAAWRSSSNIVGPARSSAPTGEGAAPPATPAGQVRPAA
jgi:hypothetical protein